MKSSSLGADIQAAPCGEDRKAEQSRRIMCGKNIEGTYEATTKKAMLRI
jgi:hypothetical protein